MSRPAILVIILIIGAAGLTGTAFGLVSALNPPEPPLQDPAPRRAATHALDGREYLYLTAEEADHVRENMVGFLEGLQSLSDAAARDDWDAMREIAAGLGQPGRDPIGQQMRSRMPDGFRSMSRQLRSDFRSLSELPDTAMASDVFDGLSAVQMNCVSCHGSYRVAPTPR